MAMPRPLFWGETRPKEQSADAAPRIHDYGMGYRWRWQ